MHPLDPLTLPLHGRILIEASAGTGKTFTIALLFLRLLVERGLSVEQILVVTFTKAATEELRGRIRLRIREALDVLAGHGPEDLLLHKMMDGLQDRKEAAILLADALTRMDEAAIFTIHGFCQRMLQEHAFESGAPFEMEFLETEQPLRNSIMEDFWRQRFYTVSEDEAAWIASLWKTPLELLNELGNQPNRQGVHYIPVIEDDEPDRQAQRLVPLFEQIRHMWLDSRKEIKEILTSNQRLSRNQRSGYGLKRLEPALEAMDLFVQKTNMPWLLPDSLALFTSTTIAGSLQKSEKHAPPVHPFFDLFDQFYASHGQMTHGKRISLLTAARTNLKTELERRKREQAQLFFDDLLSHLDTSLHNSGGRKLAARISTQFPVILVDEFQDTDPLQYRIFATINDAGKQAGLFLIGDPKQAIYAFRGADIFTYIQARRDTSSKHRFTMTCNYRSTSSMVAAVNRLFSRPNPFLLEEYGITFTPVKAAGTTTETTIRKRTTTVPPLTCLLLPETDTGKPLSKALAAEQAAAISAREIAELLAGSVVGDVHIGDTPLVAGDIAVLVRTHDEAELVRKALRKLSISSVYYSRKSVFTGKEAEQMVVLLTALINLHDGALVRTALTTDLFGYTARQMDRLNSDEHQWEEIITSMEGYRQLWQNKGFIPMFQAILAEQQVVARLHAKPSGERCLTNLLHLAELLQEASRNQVGRQGLLQWLIDQIQSPEEPSDSRQLRLESDENLVKIVTIHKAKGLEYPVVFLPFLWAARPCTEDGPLPFHHPEQPDQLIIDLGTGNPKNFQLAEQERLAGDLRLLYVAITRARCCCFFCWGRISKMEQSALCSLLHGANAPDPETLPTDLAYLQTADSTLEIKPYPPIASALTLNPAGNTASLTTKQFQGHIDASWQITSYSRLTAGHDQQPERPDYDQQVKTTQQPPGHDRFGFPRGAAAGTCLHSILEQITFTESAEHEGIIKSRLEQAGFAESWLPIVSTWIKDILQTDLEPGFSLSCLHKRDRINEMGFYFPLQSIGLQHFNRVLKEFSIPPLPDQPDPLLGLMVGFIDLVYRFSGRYYVVDYKSNHLGNSAADYHQENLRSAMLAHRYDLQYLIYSLALHRYLRSRIADYDYATSFGGISYLFLRGMHPDNEAGTGIYATRPPFDLINGLDRCCQGIEP